MNRTIVQLRPEIAHLEEYLPSESLEAFSRHTGIPIEQIIKLNLNESPYPPSPKVSQALGAFTAYNQYPSADDRALYDDLAAYLGIGREHLLLTSGSNDLLTLLCRAFLQPGDSVILCSPCYAFYTNAVLLAEGTVIDVPRQANYAIDVPAILAAIRPATKLILLTSPNNPTGNLVSRADVEALLETGRIVVVDEVYLEFAGDEAMAQSFIHLLSQYENLVVVRSLSKWAGLAGLRLGYGVCPPWLVPALRKLQLPFVVSLAARLAARATLADLPRMREHIAELVNQRERLFAACQRYPYLDAHPSWGNFLLLEITDPRLSVAQFRAHMEAHGILLRYFSAPELSRHIRISIGLADQMSALIHVLDEIDTHLNRTSRYDMPLEVLFPGACNAAIAP